MLRKSSSSTLTVNPGLQVNAWIFDSVGASITLGQKAMVASLPVVLASDQSAISVAQSGTWSVNQAGTWSVNQAGTWNINNISGTISLPTGASTEVTLSALNAKFNSLGQKTMVNSAPVVIASDQTAIPASQSGTWTLSQNSGYSVSNTARLDYSSTNVGTASWVQVLASTSQPIKGITIFDSGGYTMEIGTGAAASETRLILSCPGGTVADVLPITIASGTRISIRCVESGITVSSGQLVMNFLY